MTRARLWLAGLSLAAGVLAGCGASPDLGQQESIYVDQVSIKETTVGRLDNGWSVGVQWISNERYVDAEGKERRGLVARIGVWNDALEQNDTLEVYEGMVFPIGEQRFQVIKLKTNSSLSIAPGSSNGYIVIGQLAEDSEAVPGMGGMSLTAGAAERLFEDGSAHVYRQDGSETIDLFCHVVEGTWCYFVPQGQIEPYDGLNDPRIEDEARRITSDVAEQLTKELGVEYIAHSHNNGVKVRCARPEDTHSSVTCQVDRGGGWQELAVWPQSVSAPASGNRMSAQPILIDSPQQDRTLVITVDANRDDPTRYLTLIFEVRDKATQAILHRQQTHASSRLAWSMRWLDNSAVQLQSSDVGTYCWQEQQDGSWLEAKCP